MKYSPHIKTILSLGVACLMTSCASGTPKTDGKAWTTIPETTLKVEVNCPLLPKVDKGQLGNLWLNKSQIVEQYYICADNYATLVDLVKNRQNVSNSP